MKQGSDENMGERHFLQVHQFRHMRVHRNTPEAPLNTVENKRNGCSWPGGVDPGDDGSVALEQRLQGQSGLQDLPGGAAPGLHSRHPLRVLPETRSKKGFPSVFKIRDDSFGLL